MPKYTLYYGPHVFELKDAKAAVELLRMVQTVQQRGAARIKVPTTTGTVTLIVTPTSQIAVTADGDADELPE